MAATIEYAIRSRDQSKAGVKSAEQGIDGLRKKVEGFSKVLQGTFLGGATLAVVRQIVQFGAASVEAAKGAGLLTPELDKVTKQINNLKVAIGTGLAEGLKGAFKGAGEGLDTLKGGAVATAVAGTVSKIGQAFKLLWDLVWTTGAGMFVRVFVFMGQIGLEAIKALFFAFSSLFGQIGVIWDNVAYSVKSVWATVINWIIDQLNKVLAAYNASPLAKITGGLGQIGRVSTDLGAKPGAVDMAGITKPFQTAFSNIETMTKDFGSGVVDSFKNLYDDVLNLLKPPGQMNMPSKVGPWKGVTQSSLGYTISQASVGQAAVAPGYGAGGVASTGSWSGGGGGPLDGLLGALGPLVSTFLKLAGSISSVSMLLDPLGTILSVMMSVLEPIVNQLLAPLVGILTILGRLLGAVLTPVLQMLSPIIEFISAAFILLYNLAIMPLANAIIFVFNVIYNIIAFIWNAIASAVNALLGWAGVHLNTMQSKAYNEGFLSAIKQEDLTTAGQSQIGAQSSAGVGASYTGAPVYNITIHNQFDTGSVIDSSGTWGSFLDLVWRDLTLRQAARQGA
jgi:hypothetical protein